MKAHGYLLFWVAVFIVLGIATKLSAALTPTQVRTHIGEMIVRGLSIELSTGTKIEDISFKDVMGWAGHYRVSGSTGTIADRQEAMEKFFVAIASRTIIMDPANNATQKHIFKRHWLDNYIGQAETDALEP